MHLARNYAIQSSMIDIGVLDLEPWDYHRHFWWLMLCVGGCPNFLFVRHDYNDTS